LGLFFGIQLALKRLLKIFRLLNLLTLIIGAISISSAIAAKPQVNPSNASPTKPSSSVDRRAAEEYRQLGLSYRKQERFDEAIAALQQSVSLDPQNIDGRIILGWTQHLAKKDKAAATSLWEAIYRSPTSLQAFNAIGIVYLVRGDLPQSVILHSWAAMLKNDNEIAHYNLSLAYQRLQQYDLAIAYAQKAIELEPSNPHPFVALAIAQWTSGDRAGAKKIFRDAIGVDDRYRNPDFLNFLNEAGFNTDQIQTAKQVLASP
jgi:tetratricopeptide (TPR) repeat protein